MEKLKGIKKELLVILIGGIVFFILGLITGFLTSSNQEDKLRSEIKKIYEMDIYSENIDMKIKTKGDYAIVEKTIKEYLNEYATKIKEINQILIDETVGNILTAENYKNDGPKFEKTKKYITETKTKFNEDIDRVIEISNEEAMMNAIQNKNLDEYYISLYKELLIGNEGARERIS